MKKKGTTKTPKASKTPKSPKATSAPTTSAPTGVPSLSPTQTPRVQLFYSDEATQLALNVNADDDESDSDSLTYTVDIGTVKNLFGKDTMAVVQTSFTTTIDSYYDVDDDDLNSGWDADVYLTILAYAGCDSAATCQGVTPTPLIPEEVEMFGWRKDKDINENADDIENRDIFISTNDANFGLVGKGTGDIFLQASIMVQMSTYADTHEGTDIDVIVKNWVVIVQHEETNMRVNKFNLHTLSPTSGGPPP